MKTLIFFGSLRSIKLLKIVIGKDVEERSLNKGFIKNARLYQVKNETFPYIEFSNDFTEKVECLVGNDLQNEDIDKIQFFESTEYHLENIDCEIDNEIKNYQNTPRPNRHLGNTNADIIARISNNRNNKEFNFDMIYSEKDRTEEYKRVYLGPTTISRIHVRLIYDKGNVIN